MILCRPLATRAGSGNNHRQHGSAGRRNTELTDVPQLSSETMQQIIALCARYGDITCCVASDISVLRRMIMDQRSIRAGVDPRPALSRACYVLATAHNVDYGEALRIADLLDELQINENVEAILRAQAATPVPLAFWDRLRALWKK